MKLNEKKTATIGLGGMLLLSGVVWITAPGKAQQSDARMIFANAAESESADSRRPSGKVVAGLGIIEPASGTINLSALMPGVIASIAKSEGDTIKCGDIIAELVNDDLQAQLAQAESNVRIEAARLALIEKGPRREEIEQAEAKVREEQSSTKLFKTQWQRREVLAREGAVARETLNEAQRALTVSQERLDGAAKQLDILRQGSRPEEVEAGRATYKLAQDKLAEAQAILNKSYVRATIDGVVLRRYMEPGEAVSMDPGAVIMQIADTSQLVVRTQIDENDIGGLKIGQRASISAPSLGGKVLEGTVMRISPRLGAKTITAETATEKRDTRVLDVIVALDQGVSVPIYLRVDVVIDLDSQAKPSALQGMLDKPLRLAQQEDNCLESGCAGALDLLNSDLLGAISQ